MALILPFPSHLNRNAMTTRKIRFTEGLLPAVLASILLLNSCQKDDSEVWNVLDQQLEKALADNSASGSPDYFKLPDSDDYQLIPADPNNPLNADKVQLGRMLFNETGLGMNAKYEDGIKAFSCASCHHSRAGFQAGIFQGIADGGIGFGMFGEERTINPIYAEDSCDVQQIRTPTALNSAYQDIMLWNGQFGATGMNVGTESQWTPGTPKETNNLGYQGIETQAIAGLGVHRMHIDEDILDELGYKVMFDNVFSDFSGSDRYTKETAGLAIAAYERTLLANRAPFQLWLRGQSDAMSTQEKRGAIIFFRDAQCGACHTGPALNTMDFYGYGMKDLCDHDGNIIQRDFNAVENKGRGGFTGNPEDDFKFKVPQLYNLLNSPHYGHGGSFQTIHDVVEYKNNGVKENPHVIDGQLAEHFHPLQLNEDQVQAITDFISTGLYDDALRRYDPDMLPSGNCFPNADEQSKVDLGCN